MKQTIYKHKNKIFLSIIVLILSLFFVITYSCPANANYCNTNKKLESKSTFNPDLSPVEFKEKINSGSTLIDIRTSEEYNERHIVGASLIDFYSDDFITKLNLLDKEKEYIIYCRTGSRTSQTLNIMNSLGFKRVYQLQGGINEWEQQGLPVQRLLI